MKRLALLPAALLLVASRTTAQQQETIVIRTGTLFDGKSIVRNATVVVEGSRIARVGAETQPAAYDLSKLTVLPGLIDTHVHLASHFGPDGRASSPGETPVQQMLYAVENAYLTLMAGFTTVQSVGADSWPADPDLGPSDQRRGWRSGSDSRSGKEDQSRRRRSDQDLRLEEHPGGRGRRR